MTTSTRTEAVLDRASIERLISECKEDLETLNSVTPCCDCDRKPAGAVCAWTTKLQLMKAATSRSKENQPIIVLALTQLLSEIDFLEKAPVGCPVHNAVHGYEAEELRAGIEAIIEKSPSAEEFRADLIRLIDTVDARDSLAYRESSDAGDIVDQMIHHVPELSRVRDSLIMDVTNEKWHHVARTIADIVIAENNAKLKTEVNKT